MLLTRFFRGFFETVQFTGGKYRPDIDGLRAVAVLAVLAYHYFPGRLPGGFIGVDIFFVISGYLITGILERSFEKHSFGHVLWDFYQRRIRRIFPAVAIVLATLLVTGWLFLFPDEYKTLGAHVAAGAGFVENILLWSEAGYFDAEAIQKPLLHFWSLAVEEQFYIFWPFVLWLAIRRKWPLLDTIAAIIVISMALNIWAVWRGDTTGAFYLPMMRTWELMAGAWLAVAHRKEVLPHLPDWLASQLAWGGLLMIAVGFAAVRPTGAFPGFWALLPVLGCAFILHAGRQSVLNRVFLSWRPAVWIGLISYPLYLWHWSLLSMSEKLFGSGSAVVMRNRKMGLILLSILLSWLVYKLLETPIRKRGVKVTTTLLVIIGVIFSASIWIYANEGLPDRQYTIAPIHSVQSYTDSLHYAAEVNECHNRYQNKNANWPRDWFCTLGEKDAKEWIGVIGDSHARSAISAYDKYGKDRKIRIIFSSTSSCDPLLGIGHAKAARISSTSCTLIVNQMAEKAKQDKPRAVIVVARWLSRLKTTRYLDGKRVHEGKTALEYGLNKTAEYFNKIEIPLIYVEDNPDQPAGVPLEKLRALPNSVLRNPSKMERELNSKAVTVAQHKKIQKKVNSLLKSAAAEYPDYVHVIDGGIGLCPDSHCLIASDGRFLYHDKAGHLTVAGSEMAYPDIKRQLDELFGN